MTAESRAVLHAVGTTHRGRRRRTSRPAARGLRAVGVDTIIAESGVAKATFYEHFPARTCTIAHKQRVLAWMRDLAEGAGAEDPARLARALALLLDGARATAARLVHDAVPH